MKLDLCEIRNSVSPAIITILLGNFPETISKVSIAVIHEPVLASSAAPPLSKIKSEDAYAIHSVVHEQSAHAHHQHAHVNHDDVYTYPSDDIVSDEIINAALLYAIASDDETHAIFDEGNKPP